MFTPNLNIDKSLELKTMYLLSQMQSNMFLQTLRKLKHK
jgi:hypothetical protein